LLITFEGVGAEWQKQEICHRVIAIEAFNTSRAFAVVEVPGAEGPLNAELEELEPGCAYFVTVDSRVGQPNKNTRRLAQMVAAEDTPAQTPRVMCTRSCRLTWISVVLTEGIDEQPTLRLQWDGHRRGPHWLCKLNLEEEATDEASQVQVTEDLECAFEGLPEGLHCVEIKAATAKPSDVGCVGRCWVMQVSRPVCLAYARYRRRVTVGGHDVEAAESQLREKYHGRSFERFSERVLVEVL